MGQYRLVGSQDPANRIDRVLVEDPSEEHPDGVVLELGGDPVELTDEQYEKVAGIASLQPFSAEEGDQVADYTAEDYPDEQPAEEQQVADAEPAPGENPPAPEQAQPEPQQVARPRARKEG